MLSDSTIDPSIVQAYLETEFRVQRDQPFTLKIGSVSDDLLEEHASRRVGCSAFLTACNPYSRLLDDAQNRQRQCELAEELSRRSLTFLPGVGQHPSNAWAGEESYLVFGLNLQAAKVLGQQLEQNAIVWCDSDGKPQLILLK